MPSNMELWLQEIFAEFGPVSVRPMFGGYGVYHEGVMFALVADELVYLKVDSMIQETFSEQGLEPFVYTKQGKPMKMSYWRAPAELYDDTELAAEWAQRSYAAAQRARS